MRPLSPVQAYPYSPVRNYPDSPVIPNPYSPIRANPYSPIQMTPTHLVLRVDRCPGSDQTEHDLAMSGLGSLPQRCPAGVTHVVHVTVTS